MDLGHLGKRALVLGASRGLGATILSSSAAESVFVYAYADNIEPVDADTNVTPVKADVGIDILVNNGGAPAAEPAGGRCETGPGSGRYGPAALRHHACLIGKMLE
jgi:3-oxoacyl-[acyl-carrier protein] reductase